MHKLYLTTQKQGEDPSRQKEKKYKNKEHNSATVGASFFGKAKAFRANQTQSSAQMMNARKETFVVCAFNELPPDPQGFVYI